MMYPTGARIELPILQELIATDGVEDVRFLYERLVAYFPTLGNVELDTSRVNQDYNRWRRTVQRAGRTLAEQRQINRDKGLWTITALGRNRVENETLCFDVPDTEAVNAPATLIGFSHSQVQEMLERIGRVLGYNTEREFEFYDVVWRVASMSPRLSHVFEVQRKGNIDAALAKLKRAYEAQRSKLFLIVASERDTNRARKALSQQVGAFHEIGAVTTILSFEQLHRLHRALTSVEDLLTQIFE